jgi:hypothetical protein
MFYTFFIHQEKHHFLTKRDDQSETIKHFVSKEFPKEFRFHEIN